MTHKHSVVVTDEQEAAIDERITCMKNAPASQIAFERLVRLVWRLRQDDGCPWDKAQTHESITKNMIEEAYEAVDAIHQADSEHLCEELGDVLEQVLLHAQIALDNQEFTLEDVCHGLAEKLIRRHPHIFDTNSLAHMPSSADEVLNIWDSVKDAERAADNTRAGTHKGLLDSIPRSFPALMQAQKVVKRAHKAGLGAHTHQQVCAEAEKRMHELVDSCASKSAFVADEKQQDQNKQAQNKPAQNKQAQNKADNNHNTQDDHNERARLFGKLMFSLVEFAQDMHVDAEEALAFEVRAYRETFRACEQRLAAQGSSLDDVDFEDKQRIWNDVSNKSVQ
ncbi:nucleoside triphosphate pyrophosphohydrolase [Fannyhessea vaginae]|uniref:MazG family protein n=1 Tax=Fannyhessea vaginae DSM 15829 TaxID=525256 RepID=F1T5J7_9ACTN|nr:MazG family protein [Fannyhessea vaginae]EGF23142.1 MazG family protein [Fannyhessea vaginae DSM 15829]QPR41474.1 nucleoside triphosphate pyrophosphohydrolase [Fannyhessea vaginae]SSZ03335.1 Nucleoside triphosphate pyrophosphohydrolase [Fannyhessea vaginae]